MLIDSHCHLDMKEFGNDLREVVDHFVQQNIASVVNVGESMASSRMSLKLAQLWPGIIFGSVGIHPHNIHELDKKTLNELEELGKNKEIVAVGEIGLDYFRRQPSLPISRKEKELQKSAFLEQLHLAAKLNLPVIVHSRNAYEDTFKVLSDFASEMSGKYELRGVVHSWAGNLVQAQKFLDLGLMIGFTGNITYPNLANEIDEVVIAAPLNRILVETDAPFLPPQEYRGLRNEPSYVWEVAIEIANKKSIRLEEVEQATSDNAKLLFRLG